MSDSDAEDQRAPDPRARPGDVGRRVASRRRELGLSREQVADRAGASPNYLRYVEEMPADVEMGALVRIAGALETTTDRLLGADAEAAPGGAGAAAHPVLEELSVPECWDRLDGHGIGRIALSGADGPAVLPVGYTVVRRTLVYRTSEERAGQAREAGEVAFEVDRVDDVLGRGWSVLVVGPAVLVTRPEEVAELRRVAVRQWAGGERDAWVRLIPERVTGRSVRAA